MEELGFFIGNWWRHGPRMFASPQSVVFLDHSTPNQQSPTPPLNTFGRRTQESQELNLNWESSPSREITSETGMLFETPPNRETSKTLTPQLTSHTTGLFGQLQPITWSHPQSSEQFMCSGEQPVQAKVVARGRKRVSPHIPRIRGQNSGAVTKAKLTWSSMSFEEALTWGISCGGSIATQSLWKSKEEPSPSKQHVCGLPLTWIHGSGTWA